MIAARCNGHIELKLDPERVRALEFVGIQDFGFSILELYNCYCQPPTTMSVRGIGPTQRIKETP